MVPLRATASTGQAALVPLHSSATSHSPAGDRQTVPFVKRMLVGQELLFPVQYSGASQRSVLVRQMVVVGIFTSRGHVPVNPLQVSAASHIPALALHKVPFGRT